MEFYKNYKSKVELQTLEKEVQNYLKDSAVRFAINRSKLKPITGYLGRLCVIIKKLKDTDPVAIKIKEKFSELKFSAE